MPEPHAQQSVSGKLQGLAQAFLQYARARLDLLQHEWRLEQSRLLGQAARAGIFALGALITLQLICAFVLIAFWDTPWRLAAAGALVLIFGGVTWMAWRGMQGGADRDSQAFASTLAEFDKDREILDRLAELRDEVKKPDERKQGPPVPSRPAAPAAGAVGPMTEPLRHTDPSDPVSRIVGPTPPPQPNPRAPATTALRS